MMNTKIRQPWAKRRDGYELPLICHSLDVAACALALGAEPWLAQLIAMHDLGKCSATFQEQLSYEPHHTALGLYMGSKWLLPEWKSRAARRALLGPIMGHHGKPVSDRMVKRLHIESAYAEQAQELVKELQSIIPAAMPVEMSETDIAPLSWRIAGLTNLADWLGSNTAHFPVRPYRDGYWPDAIARAQDAVVDAGLTGTPIASRSPTLDELLGLHAFPTPLQQWAMTVELPSKPGPIVIEDVMGSGKTEAAFLLAGRIMQAGGAGGVYVAMPTMATADGLFQRVESYSRQLFAAPPTLALAHSARLHHGGYRRVMNDMSTTVDSTEWLSRESRRALLADVGIGTIDQTLMSVLPVKFQALRLFGLSKRVLIIDEAHSYDAYMSREIDRLIDFHTAQGGWTIVLSATLPKAVRSRWDAGSSMNYPQATIGGRAYPVEPRMDVWRPVQFERCNDPIEMITSAPNDAAICWICNTVNDAVQAAERLRLRGIDADLFHARYPMGQRLAIQKRCLDKWGKDSSDRRGVLVATQVVEQSVDLDFDLMISDPAPVDLLLQRSGRLWRHERSHRPYDSARFILNSFATDSPGRRWFKAGGQFVYSHHGRVWLSIERLLALGELTEPHQIRELIEAVYADDAEWPAVFDDIADRSDATDRTHAGIAETNLLSRQNGYQGNLGTWELDDDIAARLASDSVSYCVLNADGSPVCGDWRLSEVSLRPSIVEEADDEINGRRVLYVGRQISLDWRGVYR